MAARLIAPLAGASLLALAVPAAAQHTQHPPASPAPRPPAATPAQPAPHAGHAPAPAPTPNPAPNPADPHAGHAGHAPAGAPAPAPESPPESTPAPAHDHQDPASSADHGRHGEAHAMLSPLGAWPMSRDASGTSWQPDLGEHGGVHRAAGDWTLMGHALLNLVQDTQSGPRGDQKTFVAGMVMGAARRDFADGSTLNLRAMLSPDPLMGKDGYPLLLAAGETADGVHPLVDRQHPHELVMELSASYARRLSDQDSVFAYVGLPGEPAFGPPAFMHRMSAMDSPEAPITHHWLDSTHIVFGVATLGYVHDTLKIEGSAFRGREPDEDRYDIESPELDSWSVRGSWNPTPEWSLQASYADVTAPEQLEPDEDETKWSASALHTARFGADGWWASTLAWGRKTNDHGESKDAWLLETALHPDDRWTVFGRAERIDTDELVPGHGGGHGELYTVSKASVGAVHDWRVADNVRFGVGALFSVNDVPGPLEPLYGGDPDGGMLFVRLKVG